jgi:hypothetical protein
LIFFKDKICEAADSKIESRQEVMTYLAEEIYYLLYSSGIQSAFSENSEYILEKTST